MHFYEELLFYSYKNRDAAGEEWEIGSIGSIFGENDRYVSKTKK